MRIKHSPFEYVSMVGSVFLMDVAGFIPCLVNLKEWAVAGYMIKLLVSSGEQVIHDALHPSRATFGIRGYEECVHLYVVLEVQAVVEDFRSRHR